MRSVAGETAVMVNKLVVNVVPNPSTTQFRLISKRHSNEPLTVTVVDVLGRVVEKRVSVAANGTILIGGKLLTGVYFAEVVQGAQKERLKLVMQ